MHEFHFREAVAGESRPVHGGLSGVLAETLEGSLHNNKFSKLHYLSNHLDQFILTLLAQKKLQLVLCSILEITSHIYNPVVGIAI